MNIAIIGAGISGLTLARELERLGTVTVFEKSRGVGGRMATRRAGDFHFDHGAQCFTARTTRFRQFIMPYIDAGIVAKWDGKVINLEPGKPTTERMWFETHLVAAPGMNSLCKAMADGQDIRLTTEIAPFERTAAGQWQLTDTSGTDQGTYDWVISTAPPVQTARLFGRYGALANDIQAQRTQPCFALMVGFPTALAIDWVAAKVRNSPIKWISVNSSKSGRNTNQTTLVAHTRKSWTHDHLSDELDTVQAQLLETLEALTGIQTRAASHVATHRWRYALVEDARKSGPYCDPFGKLAATSDWAATSRIEEAWLSAVELANRIAAVP